MSVKRNYLQILGGKPLGAELWRDLAHKASYLTTCRSCRTSSNETLLLTRMRYFVLAWSQPGKNCKEKVLILQMLAQIYVIRKKMGYSIYFIIHPHPIEEH